MTKDAKEQAKKELRAAEKLVDDKLEEKALKTARELEQKEVPSAEHILQEHKHLVHHEEELKALLSPVQLAPVRNLGKFVPGKGVGKIPRIENKKKRKV